MVIFDWKSVKDKALLEAFRSEEEVEEEKSLKGKNFLIISYRASIFSLSLAYIASIFSVTVDVTVLIIDYSIAGSIKLWEKKEKKCDIIALK